MSFGSDARTYAQAQENIAKALWGTQSSKVVLARRPLRESLQVGDDSPLRDVGMRNAFEHLDERIDDWWRHSPKHSLVDRSIGPLAAFNRYAEI